MSVSMTKNTPESADKFTTGATADFVARCPARREQILEQAYERLKADASTVEGFLRVSGLSMRELMEWCKANDKEDPREKVSDVSKLPLSDKLKIGLHTLQGFKTYADVLSGYDFDTIDDLQGVPDVKLLSYNGIGKELITALNKALDKIGICRTTHGQFINT